jgi:hypothetical protein
VQHLKSVRPGRSMKPPAPDQPRDGRVHRAGKLAGPTSSNWRFETKETGRPCRGAFPAGSMHPSSRRSVEYRLVQLIERCIVGRNRHWQRELQSHVLAKFKMRAQFKLSPRCVNCNDRHPHDRTAIGAANISLQQTEFASAPYLARPRSRSCRDAPRRHTIVGTIPSWHLHAWLSLFWQPKLRFDRRRVAPPADRQRLRSSRPKSQPVSQY